jgi:hypothetical protein
MPRLTPGRKRGGLRPGGRNTASTGAFFPANWGLVKPLAVLGHAAVHGKLHRLPGMETVFFGFMVAGFNCYRSSRAERLSRQGVAAVSQS